MMPVKFTKYILVFAGSLALGSIGAIEINVNLKNGSRRNQPAKVEELRLIHLKGGMQVLQTLKNISARAKFDNLPASDSPYMVQAMYKSVLYSKVIPPRAKKTANVDLVVYDTVAKPNNKMAYRIFYDIRYMGEDLFVFSLIHFSNESNVTFQEKEGGIYIHLPAAATGASAAVSVGSGVSNIQWLALTPTASKVKSGAYLLSHPVKPGGKTYRLEFKIPYKNKKAEIALKDFYRRDSAFQLFVNPEDINLKLKNYPDWVPQPKEIAELQKKVIALPETNQTLLLQLTGGTPSPMPKQRAEPGSVQIASLLSYTEKAILAVASMVILWLFYFYLSRKPNWLQQMRLREKAKLEMQLKLLTEGDYVLKNKKQKISDLRKRILFLENQLSANG